MKFIRSTVVLLLCLSVSSWGWIPGGLCGSLKGVQDASLREAILAVRAIVDSADIQTPSPFSRALAQTLRIARAAAGLDEAIGQDRGVDPVFTPVISILSSPHYIIGRNPSLCKLISIISPFNSIDIKPPHPPPRTVSHILSIFFR